MKSIQDCFVKLVRLLALAILLTTATAHAQSYEASPELRILTYTNTAYSDAPGYQNWAYPEGNRHGGGYTRDHHFTGYSRYGGGQITNFHAWNSYESGYGGAYNVYNEWRNSTLWFGPCPATAQVYSYWTNSWWWDGMEMPYTDQNASMDYATNYVWEPYESRKALNIWFQPTWTLEFDWGLPHLGCFYKRTNYVRADTTLELFSGGYTNSTDDVTMQLNVWAFDNIRGRWLTWDEMTITIGIPPGVDDSLLRAYSMGAPTLSLTPDTNNNVFFLMPDNQRFQVNFSFHPTNALPPEAVPGSYDYSFWAYPARLRHLVAVDRNGDGAVDFGGTNDLTSPTLPYLFWINNDYDIFAYYNSVFTGPAYFEFDDVETTATSATDYSFNYIHNERDLEDFSRLHLQVPFPFADANWGVQLKGGKLKLFAGGDGSTKYLTDPSFAATLVGTNGTVYLGDTGDGPVFIPSTRFDSSQTLLLLFEAGQAGAMNLEAELVWRGNVVGKTRVWMNLFDVKSMYDQWVVADLDTAWPSVDYVPPTVATQTVVDSGVVAQLTAATNYVLFVHGWNMKKWEKEAFASTAFKRLWWQGYRGRFGAFRWPTYKLGGGTVLSFLSNYDCSEYNSWRSAMALESVLVQLNAPSLCMGNVGVIAHSMGNVVTGEALRRLGTNCIPGTDQKFAKTYLAMQGAIPAHCYDRDEHFAPFPGIRDNNTWNAYSYYWDMQGPTYMAGLNGAGAYWNYCNTRDFALDKWVFDQQLKPDGSLSYYWSTSRFPNSGFYRIQSSWTYDLNFPNDTHEIFAFGAEPRSFALGASTSVNGLFGGQEYNLQSQLSFDNTHNFHSKQFRSTIQLQKTFWERVLNDFDF